MADREKKEKKKKRRESSLEVPTKKRRMEGPGPPPETMPARIGKTYKMTRMTLLQHLKKILTKYPDNSQILREMIQNAEDAGANVVKICFESFSVQPESRSEIGHYLAPPGLLLYNDALFTEKDFEGISSLNISNKEKELLKVGKFGLGFKSVFHITDNPVIISGSTMLILCPIKSEKNEDECWSVELKDLSKECETLESLMDKFGFNKTTLKRGVYEGTLIWLPLRRKASSISSTIYDERKVDTLFDEFKTEAFYNVLFLRNIDRIQLFKNTTDKPIYEIEMMGIEPEVFQTKRREFKVNISGLQKVLPVDDVKCELETMLKAKTSDEEKQFVVVHCLTGTSNLSGELEEFIKVDHESQYSPYSGIAFCLNSTNKSNQETGHIFCCQPLPLTKKSMTGLPVHVNALFDLDENRQHIKLPPANHKTVSSDNSFVWNNMMISELLPRCYLFLLDFLKARSIKNKNTTQHVKDVYDAIPNPQLVDKSWNPLAEKLYKVIMKVQKDNEEENEYDNDTKGYFFTKNGGEYGRWVTCSDAVFDSFDHTVSSDARKIVCEILLLAGENVVCLPSHLASIVSKTQIVRKLNPKYVIRVLHTLKDRIDALSKDKKLVMLEFLLLDDAYERLSGLRLLPKNDNTFSSFSTHSDVVYVIDDKRANLFPGMEFCILTRSYVDSSVWKGMRRMAEKDMFQLRLVDDDNFPVLFTNLIEKHWKHQHGGYSTTKTSLFIPTWIKDIWNLITSQNYEMTKLESCPLIPVYEHKQQTTPTLYNLKGKYMFCSDGHFRLTTTMQKVLTILGVTIISKNQVRHMPETIRDRYIKTPNPINVLLCFAHSDNDDDTNVESEQINKKLYVEELEEMCNYLMNHRQYIQSKSKKLLRKIQMFQQHDNQGKGGMVSLNKNNLVLRNSSIPETISFTQKYILEKYLPLVVILDGKVHEEKECVLNILDAMIKGNKLYSHKHMLELAKYLSSNYLDECIKMKMRQVEFVPSSDNNHYRADVLFDPESKILCDLYRNFKGMFPKESFLKRNPSMIPFLRKLGLKSEAHVTSEEVCQIVKHIDKSGSKVTANALLKLLEANQSKYHDTLLNDIREFRWVPCDGKELWKDLKVTTMIASETCKPSDASSFHLNRFCGSVRNIVVGTDSQQKLDKFYKWSEPPPLPDVVQHLSNVTNAQRVKHRGKYAEYAVDILEFINSNCDVYKLDSSVRTALSKIKCAPCISNELHLPTTVVRSYGPFVNYRLEPYIFELDNEATKCMDIYRVIGVKEETCLHHLKECIQSIGNKYHDNCKRQPREVNVDRQLLANILSTIIELNDGENLGKLLIPIDVPDSQGIVLREAVDCTRRSNQRHMQLFTTYDDDVIYSHPSIDHIAEKLGVKSENQRFILSDQFELCPWGQKIELTTEISNLLRRYSDGMAVLKEMVQNAEDAGATVINFMYDERENSDARVSVLTPGMADCQGQALWVYNDAEFTDKDFKNIIKLGEKTKIECPEKIGKFGLGFCSVYNLTDVPIILSGDRFGVFDPNCCHLGELIVEGTPGILLKMSSRLIKTKEDQFKPFQGVFGCNFGMPDFKFNGTLFRLPLRTRMQATSQNQKIRQSEYSKKEMIELFSKFREYIADLLLFTENIKEINFFGLKPSAKRPEKEQTLLFKAESKISKRSMDRSLFLRSINEAMTNPNKELPKHLAICNLKEISIHVSKSAKNIFKDNPNVKLPLSERCSWIISNSTGIGAIQMSRELREDGAYALGAVAIPVELSNGSLGNFQSIDNLPNGFSNTPRMFCFLPIPHPKNTGLPLHINGCFMIDDGRQHILSSNTDRTGSKLRNWNEIMLEEVVLNAYFMILNYIVCLPKQKIHRVKYWDIWPQGKDIEEIGGLRTEFYRRIIENDEKVFYRLSSRHEKVITASFSQAVFLEPLFRKSNVGEAAFEFTDEFHNEKTVLMDIPVEIYAYLFKTDTMFIQQKVIFKKTFYEKYFFPNIRNASLKRRNVLLREALRDKTLHFLVQEHKCIPVKCSGDLRTPSELVSEKGPIASMFDECDQRFLSEDFQEFESVLIDLGMMYDSMPSDLLLDRVNSVSIIKQKKQRSNEILRYLNSSFDKHEDIVDKLQDSDFLPVMMKPKSWRLPWKATKDERNLLLSPVNLFTPYQMNLVGCVEFVADIDRDNIEISKETMSWIGFKKVEKPVVIKQLTVIGDLNLKSSKGIESIMDFIYSTLGRQIGKQHDFFGHSLLQSLKTKRIIKVGNTMVQPNSVAFKIQYQPCEPYLYQLENAMYDNEVQRQFCELLGIEKCFLKPRLLEVLFEIYERNGSQVTQECCRSIVNILHNLSLRSVLTDEEKSAIRVPDNTCTLREVDDICYGELDDEGFEYEDEKFPMVHGDINTKTLEYLGIMPKRIMYLKNASDELPFGQHEKLVVRLSNLLKDYPSDHSVLNELLQNADDASASEIHFVLDLRQHKTKQIFSKKWKDQQGPALCVFNDARFTENDIEGIQKLGEGSKNDDVTKTGQFGVGFNSVYHITDVPSFLTRWTNEHGEEDGACCIFDPHCQYIDLAKPNNPGRRLSLSKLRSKYSDNFDCYLQDILPSEVGTWFRLPLRNPDVKSEITSSKITLGDLEKLLKSMRKKMTTSLLFLKNVKKISISTIKEGSSQLSNTYYVEASVSKKDLGKISRFASDIDDIKRKNIELERLNMQEIAFRKKNSGQ